MAKYHTIKITDKQREMLDEMRVHRPDVGPKSYEKTLLVVIADVITKSIKYDELVIRHNELVKKYDELMKNK